MHLSTCLYLKFKVGVGKQHGDSILVTTVLSAYILMEMSELMTH